MIERSLTGRGFEARTSLARTAQLLVSAYLPQPVEGLSPVTDEDWSVPLEATGFGPARRLRAPVRLGDATLRWERPAVALGSSAASW